MRSFSFGSVALLTVAAIALGCGGKSTTGGGGSTGTTVAATVTSTTGAAVTTSTSGSTSSGMMGCSKTTELTPAQFQRIAYNPMAMTPNAAFQYSPGVMLGGAPPDHGEMSFWDLKLTGKQDLASTDNSNFKTCTTCVLVHEDVDMAGTATKEFFQIKGSVDLGTTKFPAISGSLTDVTLAEATIDAMTGDSTIVPGGECLHIATASFAFTPAPAGWTCDPGKYGDKVSCDCDACGVVDEDCTATPALPVPSCGPGQTCAADGKTCMGNVTGWTCAQNLYNQNHNVPAAMQAGTCDCSCGIADPDCANMTAVVNGCNAGAPKCNANGVCVPTGWKCPADFYGDKAQPQGGCDCGCGVQDVDCKDLNKTSCDYCDDTGSCDTVTCMDPNSKINATNNAVCM